MFLEILLGKRFLETLKTVPEIRACKACSWEPCLETCSWKPLPGNPCLGTSSCEPWEPLAGNPCLVPGNLAWKPCLGSSGNLAWELFLGTRFPTLHHADLAAPRDSPGKGNPSTEPGSQRIWLLRPAPEPLLWLKTPSLRCWGKMLIIHNYVSLPEGMIKGWLLGAGFCVCFFGLLIVVPINCTRIYAKNIYIYIVFTC